MAYQMDLNTTELGWSDLMLRTEVQRLLLGGGQRFRRLWAYYRNPTRPWIISSADQGSERPYRQAMEWGLPSRITGLRAGLELFCATKVEGVARKEVVIENDIGWRIDAMVDYLFGQPIVINSTAADPNRRAIIEQVIRQIFGCNGGITFLQQLALIGAVYGFVDVLVKFDCAESSNNSALSTQDSALPAVACGTADLGQPAGSKSDHVTAAEPVAGENDNSLTTPGVSHPSPEALDRLARRVRLEIVEPARALPLCSPMDYRDVCAYAQVYPIRRCGSDNMNSAAGQSLLSRIKARLVGAVPIAGSAGNTIVVDLITPTTWQRYEDETLVAEGTNSLGRLPLVHIQNTAIPMEYSGASEVEPLIPIQDELNTRLSDRAFRITMQSFKMYLGKGIENFTQMPVAPGRMWLTDNPDAEIVEFGGDNDKLTSEENHINELREAMDKISSVTPIAAGAIKGRIGNLTSAAALKVTMLALLAKTDRKRTAYGIGIEQICELALAWLDAAGLFHTTAEERRIEINWPDPGPQDAMERLQEAQAKIQIGIPRETVIRELGY